MLIGQFTYTACQTPGPYSSTPGWKVKQVQPAHPGIEMPPAAVQAAVRPFGAFDAPAVPSLATQSQIDQLPRCLRLDLLEGSYRSVAHLAAAGRDHSGRDAFFAHGVLVALTDSGAPLPAACETSWGLLRPADLWGAGGWLTPYRAEAIEAAVVGAPPEPSDASPLNPERREDFLDLHPGQREFVFAAAERTLTSGLPLIIVGLPVEVAIWTSLISHLLLPSVGWTLTFSTYEAGAHPDVLRAGSPAIIGVPTKDAAPWRRITADQGLVHDPGKPQPKVQGGYRLPDGSLLPIGPWALLAEQISNAGLESAVRFAVDDLGSRVGAALDRWPLLGLAAAVLTLPVATLEANQHIARLATVVAGDHFPTGYQGDPSVLAELVDAIFRFSPDSVSVSERLLAAMDLGMETSGALVDRLLDGYLRTLMATPQAFRVAGNRWLPMRLQLSGPVADRLLADLDGLISWADDRDQQVPRARLVLLLATVAETLGWATGDELPTVQRLIGNRVRSSVVPLMLGEQSLGEPSPSGEKHSGERPPGEQQWSAAEPWPRIPSWLWRDILVDAIGERLPTVVPGSMLSDPRLRRTVDDAAGPLPTTFVAGETLSKITLLDGERAAAALLARGDQPISSAQAEVLAAAAFLRTVLDARGKIQVRPDRLFDELRKWFPQPEPRPVVLWELIEQLWGAVPMPDLCRFTAAALRSVPPDVTTAKIVREIQQVTGPDAFSGTDAKWHLQFARPVPPTSREVALDTMPLTRPDYPEKQLLNAVAAGHFGPVLAAAGRQRIAHWVLILAAQSLDLPGNAVAMEQMEWLAAAAAEPLMSQLNPLYPSAAKSLIEELNRTRRRPPVAPDVLAAEWVIRSRLVAMRVGGDPAQSFFVDTNGGVGGWADGVRVLLRAETRPREQLVAWLHRVRRSAEEAARAAQLPLRPGDQHQVLIESAVETATGLASLSGLMGRMRRTPAQPEGW